MTTSCSVCRSAHDSKSRNRPQWVGAFAALILGAVIVVTSPLPSSAQDEVRSVLVVSRARILTDTVAARSLRDDEAALRQRLKQWIAAEKLTLEADEKRLTELRAQLPREEFDKLTGEFDQKVRSFRRDTQRFEAAIQASFRSARKDLVTNLYPILIEVLQRHGADLIIDADQILIASPNIDMTNEVIELYNARVAPINLAPIDLPVIDQLVPEPITPSPTE